MPIACSIPFPRADTPHTTASSIDITINVAIDVAIAIDVTITIHASIRLT